MAQERVDLSGNDLTIDRVYVGASTPGAAGTLLAGSELTVLDGVTAGTATASKALVVGADKEIATLGAVTMAALVATTGTFSGALAGPRAVVADAAFASPTLLTAAQSGALCVFDETAGAIFTLPAAAAGLWYDFVVAVASSSNAHRVACTTGDFLLGSIMSHATDDTGLSSAYAANGTTHLAIQLDSDATGRLAGSKFRVTAISASQWVIEGDLLATGTVATPFETS